MTVESTKKGKGKSDGNSLSNEALHAEYYSSKSIWFSKRFLIAIVVFLCFINVSMLMNNVNIAVVEMTSAKTITIAGNTIVVRPAEFQWDTITISTVASAFWCGSTFTILAAYFVDKFGGSVSCAICLASAGILTLLHPATLNIDFNLFLVCRFLTGFFGNSFCVCVTEVYSRWFPKKERSALTAFGYNGMNVGVAISFPLFGYIADKFEWRTVFYISGSVSVFVALVCIIVVRNRPTQDTFISKKELSYILHETDDTFRKQEPHPYKKILLSRPVLALCLGKVTTLWAITVLTWSMPFYINDMTDKSTTEIGFLSSIPVVIQMIMYPTVGALLDFWNNIGRMKLTRIHKITIGLAFVTSSICLVSAVLINAFSIEIFLIILAVIIASIGPLVFEPITVYLSPNDCVVISGLGKITASISVIVARTSVGYMTVDHTPEEWNNCFLLCAGVLIFGAVLFMSYGSSEAQPWSSFSNSQQEHRPLIMIKYRRKSST